MRKKKLIMVASLAVIAIAAIIVYEYSSQIPNVIIGLRITYEDGTSRVFYPFGKLPLTIVDVATGLNVSMLSIDLAVTPVYTGLFKNWTVTGTIYLDGYQDAAVPILLGRWGTYDAGKSGTNVIPSGSGYAWPVVNLPVATIESWYAFAGNTVYTIKVSSTPITMSIGFKEGNVRSLTVTPPTVEWDFKYVAPNGFTSLSVKFTARPSF